MAARTTPTQQRPGLKLTREELRLALGISQMLGAVIAFGLLMEQGLTSLSLGVAVGTSMLTTVSILIFGSRRPRK